ncbi:hypothetical protein [Hymenobacter sp.]|uniref:hypothetical protein n=1 Tax=Hymenobacter sp. TaxID=1898978 RepID=UPI002EDB1AB3
MAKKTPDKPSQPVATGTTLAECQQQLLQQLKSGQYALSSADKEGYRTLCYYRQAFLYASVGDEGTSLLRLSDDEGVLAHVGQRCNSKLVLEDGSYRWSYDLTEAEQVERWQEVLAKLTPFTESSQQFVARVLQEFAALADQK